MQVEAASEFKVYPQRHTIVGLFILAQAMMGILVNTFTPVAAYLGTIYDLDPVVINLTGLLFVLMHPLFTFPAAYFIDTYGTRTGIFIGCVFCILGTSTRLLINQGFGFAILGNILAGIGRPFILNCQTKVAANWFTAETRGGITQLLTLVLNVSLIIGIFIPGIVFGKYEPAEDGSNIDEGKNLAFELMVVEMIMALICCVPNMLLQKSKPPTPPSASGNVPRQPFAQALKGLFTNKDYVLLLISFGCFFGIFNGISVVLSYLIKPWFGDNDLPFAVAAVGGSPVVSGIIGVVVLGSQQRKSGQFKKWVLICMTGSMAAIVLFYPLLNTDSLFWASFISAVNSFFLIPLVPIMLELACQMAFPVGEGSAAGMLFAIGNFFGFLFGLILSVIVEGETKAQTLGGLGFCLGTFVVGMILVLFMKEKLNRKQYEQSTASERNSQVQPSAKNENGMVEAVLEGKAQVKQMKAGLLQKQKDKSLENNLL